MFTGIIEEIGTVQRVEKGRNSALLTIRADTVLADVAIGDSIAVNGVCLTVVSFGGNTFSTDVMHETLDRSSLAAVRSGTHVNLERAMPASGRFGGHIVAGHVDGLGEIKKIQRDDTAIWYTIETEPCVMRYIVDKGSITIDGISLTVARLMTDRFAVSIIPHTAHATTLGQRRVGDRVNLEADIIGKYVEKLMSMGQSTYQNSDQNIEQSVARDAARETKANAAQGTRTNDAQNTQPIDKDFLARCGF